MQLVLLIILYGVCSIDSGIKKQLRLLEQRMKQYEKTEQKLYSAMFEN